MNGLMDQVMDGSMDRLMDRSVVGWTDGCKSLKIFPFDSLGGCFPDHVVGPLAAEVASETNSGSPFVSVVFRSGAVRRAPGLGALMG